MVDNPYYIRVPFGYSGDRAAIPISADPEGPLSYTYGYGGDYSLPRSTNPDALTIPRESFNQLMYASTANIQQYQQYGAPWFITDSANGGSPFAYSKSALVRWDNGSTQELYLSLVDSNTADPSDNTKWLQFRTDMAYLGVAQTFSAIQTIAASGTPIILNSTNSTARKITFKDNGTDRGGLGASSAYSVAAFLPDLTTIAGGWDSAGHLLPGAAATYDVGSVSAQFRNMIANRFTVLGGTAPTNGIYLSTTNTVGIAANSALVAAFSSAGMINTTIGNTNTAVLAANKFTMQDNSDATKQMNFVLSTITTGTTRSYIWPDKNGTVAMTSDLAASAQIQTISGSTAANALTVGILPNSMQFRSTTASDGTISTVTVGSTISLVVPSGATLGTISGVQSRIAVVEINNAGTGEVAVINLAGGVSLDETGLINTTAISAGATSASVFYSTTARTGVAYRVMGYIDSTQTTAGAWAQALTVQGAGGEAFTAMSSLGYGQTWQSVTRNLGTTYYNTTGKPIVANIVVSPVTAGGSLSNVSINGGTAFLLGFNETGGVGSVCSGSVVIPAGASYVFSGVNATSPTVFELR